MARRADHLTRWSSRRQPARYGGAAGLKGSLNAAAKLTEEKVAEMRRLRRRGHSLKQLARRFRVSEAAVSRAVRRITFRHVR